MAGTCDCTTPLVDCISRRCLSLYQCEVEALRIDLNVDSFRLCSDKNLMWQRKNIQTRMDDVKTLSDLGLKAKKQKTRKLEKWDSMKFCKYTHVT